MAKIAALFKHADIPAQDGRPAIVWEYLGDTLPLAEWWYERGLRFVPPTPADPEEFSVEALANEILEGVDGGDS